MREMKPSHFSERIFYRIADDQILCDRPCLSHDPLPDVASLFKIMIKKRCMFFIECKNRTKDKEQLATTVKIMES